MSMTPKFLFVSLIALAVVVVVIAGLFTAGSPGAERTRRADQQRVNDLQQISYAVDQYWTRNGSLPSSLDELAKSPDVAIQSIRDPQSGEPYAYRQASPLGEYQLCATFESATPQDAARPVPPPDTFWDHDVGEKCFELQTRTDTGMMKAVPVTR